MLPKGSMLSDGLNLALFAILLSLCRTNAHTALLKENHEDPDD